MTASRRDAAFHENNRKSLKPTLALQWFCGSSRGSGRAACRDMSPVKAQVHRPVSAREHRWIGFPKQDTSPLGRNREWYTGQNFSFHINQYSLCTADDSDRGSACALLRFTAPILRKSACYYAQVCWNMESTPGSAAKRDRHRGLGAVTLVSHHATYRMTELALCLLHICIVYDAAQHKARCSCVMYGNCGRLRPDVTTVHIARDSLSHKLPHFKS